MNKHYLARYNKIINHYKTTITEGFVEKHHIIPRCMGGSDDKFNLVALPVRVHFICHYLLHKAYPNVKGLALALSMMTVNNPYQKRQSKSYLYEVAKTVRSSAMKGFKHSPETIFKMKKPKSNKENYRGPKTKNHAKAISNALKNKPKSKTHIENLKNSMKLVYQNRKQKQIKKVNKIREQFIESGLTRQAFSIKHSINKSTLKGYLRGI